MVLTGLECADCDETGSAYVETNGQDNLWLWGQNLYPERHNEALRNGAVQCHVARHISLCLSRIAQDQIGLHLHAAQ